MKYHFFAFIIALFISFFVALFVIKLPVLNQIQAKNKIISGNKTSYSGLFENLKANENLELEYPYLVLLNLQIFPLTFLIIFYLILWVLE